MGLTRRFCREIRGKIFSVSEKGVAAAETHVSEARHGAPAFVTHFRPGPPAERWAGVFGEKGVEG